MKDSHYFPHDYNARRDERIIRLIKKMGFEGYGVFWAIIENLYEAGGSIAADYEVLEFGLHAEAKLIQAVTEGFGLFYIRNSRIGSQSVDRRIAEREDRIIEGKKNAAIRWGNREPMGTHCDPNAINKVNKVSKVSKVNKETDSASKFLKPTLKQVEAYCSERKNNINPEQWFAYYEANGWKVGKNPMRNWKAAIVTWEKNGFHDPKPAIPKSQIPKFEAKCVECGSDCEEKLCWDCEASYAG